MTGRRISLPISDQRFRDHYAEQIGITDSATYPVLSLPSYQSVLRPIPPARRLALEAHLLAIYDEAAREDGWPPPTRPPIHPEAEALLRQACSMCGGNCCSTAKDHAYLNAGTVWRVMQDDPHFTAQDFVAAYLSALPSESWEGSCLFHGPAGCSLPRRLRSDTCNVHYCPPLAKWRDAMLPDGPFRAMVVAGEPAKLVVFVDGGKVQPVPLTTVEDDSR
ncbi:MAG: hypothetical protein EBV06_04620 [Planctomycetia bacterium]|nr:hypothetical protein [Planctomycetia bacterium]